MLYGESVAVDIGAQIKELREKKNIDINDLAIGICTDESLRNIETGKEAVSKLLLEIIFQRLGKSTDKLEFIVSEKIYEEEEQLELFEECLERGEGEQADAVLEQWRKSAPEDSNVHEMFYFRSKAYAAFRIEKNLQMAKEWMKKALDITMPEWQVRSLESYIVSTIELENLLAYAKVQLIIGTEAELKEAEKLLLAGSRFINTRISDGEEHAKIFSKCAYLLANLYLKQGKIVQAEQTAGQAFKELQTYGISYFMEPLLEVLIQCNLDVLTEKPPYEKYLAALQHLKQFAGEECRFTDSVFKNCSQQTYYIDHELFHTERVAQGYSQAQMIEGVYKNPESLSRAERGKVTMRDSKLIRLFHKLGIDKTRYNGFVVTDKYEVLELKQKVDIFLSRECYKEAEEVLEKLRNSLDLNIPENRRYVQGDEIVIGRKKGERSKEEFLEQAMDLLQETYRLQTNGVYRSPMDREVSLINQIGILLRELGRKEEAIQLFVSVTKAMENSKVSLKKRSRKYSLLRTNLARWKASAEMAKENIDFTLSCGKLGTLPVNYMTAICAMMDEPANREICREMIKDAYFLCEMALNDVNKEATRKYYKKKFDEEL